MDADRLATISRQVGAAPSRRAAVAILATALTTGLVARREAEEVSAGTPIVHCKSPGKKCQGKHGGNQKCCSGRCNKGRCMCGRKGHPCWEPLEGGGCCSNKCQDGRCK